ncbi:MAG: hypothetical protein ABFD64_03335 [Armatimonadota bacterium]
MRNQLYSLIIIVFFVSITSPAFTRAIQAQVSTPDVGGPSPNVGGTTTVTPGGVQAPAAPEIKPEEPEITPAPEQPGEVAPPTVVEPTAPTDNRTVPKINMNEPPTQSTPAGVGAGPGTASEVPTGGFAETGTTAARTQETLIPRAGIELGWLSLLGGAMTGAGIAMRRRKTMI